MPGQREVADLCIIMDQCLNNFTLVFQHKPNAMRAHQTLHTFRMAIDIGMRGMRIGEGLGNNYGGERENSRKLEDNTRDLI